MTTSNTPKCRASRSFNLITIVTVIGGAPCTIAYDSSYQRKRMMKKKNRNMVVISLRFFRYSEHQHSCQLQPVSRKVRKVRCEEASRDVPQPVRSEGLPQLRVPVPRARNREEMETSSDDVTAVRVKESLSSLPESERPISPFYMSSPCSATHWKADSAHFLERTIRLAVEQHLFDTQAGSGLAPSSGLAEVSPAVAVTTKQMHPRQKDLDESQKCKDMCSINKENIPSSTGNGVSPDGERRHGGSNHSHDPRTPRAHRHGNPSTVRSHRHDSQEPFTVRSHCRDNQDPLTVRSHRYDNQDFLTVQVMEFCISAM